MRKHFTFILVVFAIFALSGCASSKVVDLVSPCVSNHGGPCQRIPVNEWFLKSYQPVIS